MNDRERRGCFLINSALEVAPHDRQLGALVADRLAEIEAFFYRSIKAAQAKGAVPRNRVSVVSPSNESWMVWTKSSCSGTERLAPTPGGCA